jgi:hypothetical protein
MLTAIILAAWLVWWDLWGKEFNYKDDDRPVPMGLHVWYAIALLVCSAGVMALCVAVIRSVVQIRSSRGELPRTPQKPAPAARPPSDA